MVVIPFVSVPSLRLSLLFGPYNASVWEPKVKEWKPRRNSLNLEGTVNEIRD